VSALSPIRLSTASVGDVAAQGMGPGKPVVDTASSVLVRSQEIVEASRRKRVGGAIAAPGTSAIQTSNADRTDSTALNVSSGPAAILNFPKFEALRPQPQAFLVLAEWDGIVLEIGDDTIAAQLVPISGNGVAPQTEAEIPCDEISDSDRELVCPGALFRLAVGYVTSNGTRTHFSRVVFRRLPAWSRQELDQADALAEEYFDGTRVE
jgi:hypothetical protein